LQSPSRQSTHDFLLPEGVLPFDISDGIVYATRMVGNSVELVRFPAPE
jgi:hypothetical protein